MNPSPYSKKTRLALLDQIFEDWLSETAEDNVEVDNLKRQLAAYERAVREVMYRDMLLRMITVSHKTTEDVFLTINPPPETRFEDFRNAVEAMLEILPGVYLYAFEATGNVERCPHVHILFHHTLSGSSWGNKLKQIQNRFSHIVNTKNSHFFNVKHVVPEEVHLVVKYIMKTHPPKNGAERTKREETEALRLHHNLDDYYSNIEGAVIQGLIEN